MHLNNICNITNYEMFIVDYETVGCEKPCHILSIILNNINNLFGLKTDISIKIYLNNNIRS
jgi:hypothetical protein